MLLEEVTNKETDKAIEIVQPWIMLPWDSSKVNMFLKWELGNFLVIFWS